MTTTLLTVRSIDGAKLDSATLKLFIVERMGTVEANLNADSTQSVTEAGDTSNQCASWIIYGTGAKLYWSLKLNAAGDREVSIYADSFHNNLVARGSHTGDGIVNCLPFNNSGIQVQVTVTYSATEDDSANTIVMTNWNDMNDTQMPGNSQFSYAEADGHTRIYTVDEAVAAIQADIASSTSTVLSISGSLSTAQITTLSASPVAYIAAPGAGYAIQILGGAISYTRATADITGNLTCDLVNSTTLTILANATNAFSGASSKITRFLPVAGLLIANEGVSLKMNTGNPTMTTSTGTATFTLLYTVIAI